MTPAEERAEERKTMLVGWVGLVIIGIVIWAGWASWDWVKAVFTGLLGQLTEPHPTTLEDIRFLLVVIILILFFRGKD